MSNAAAPAVRLFRALGTTDEATTCDYCGRIELRKTVRLAFLDADGTLTGDVAYYGTGCAATAGKRTVKDIIAEAKASELAEREARRIEEDRKHAEWTAARNAWIAEHVGPDALDLPRKYGFNSTVRLVQHFIDSTGNRP